MEDRNEKSAFSIIKCERQPTLQEIAADFYERSGITKEELTAFIDALNAYNAEVERRLREKTKAVISAVISAVEEAIPALVDVLKEITRAVEEELAVLNIEHRARRRRRDRERARRIEQEYRAEIRRCERQRFYRRIYKPPSGNRRKNRQ